MNPQPQIGRTKALCQVTARSVLLVLLLGFVLALSAARGHVVGTLVHGSSGGAAGASVAGHEPGLEAGRDVPRGGDATAASMPAETRGCAY